MLTYLGNFVGIWIILRSTKGISIDFLEKLNQMVMTKTKNIWKQNYKIKYLLKKLENLVFTFGS